MNTKQKNDMIKKRLLSVDFEKLYDDTNKNQEQDEDDRLDAIVELKEKMIKEKTVVKIGNWYYLQSDIDDLMKKYEQGKLSQQVYV